MPLTLFKALADQTRLRLIAILAQGEFTVQDITVILSMGQSRISRHLKILVEAGILSVKRQGTWGYYRLEGDNPLFLEIWPALSKQLWSLPERDADLEGVARVLDARRRQSLEFFDRHARQWDLLAQRVLPVAPYRDQLIDEVPSCRLILEVGVGTGGLLKGLGHKAPQVVGVDHSPSMVEEARRRVQADGLAGIEVRLGEMSRLPLSDAEADCAVLNMVLHHAARPAQVFEEVSRVVRPLGGLVIADLVRHEKEWVRERMADLWLGFEERELKAWLAAAGFTCDRFHMIEGEGDQQGVFLLTAHKNSGAGSRGPFSSQ